MQIMTKTFGELDISEEKIIMFQDGLPGFEHLKRFILLILDQTRPFLWLQAVDEDVSLPLISPFDILADYSPEIDDQVFKDLELDREEDLLVLAVSVIPREVAKMTANLAAPVLINITKNFGRQVLTEGSDYEIRQPIFESVCQIMQGEKDHADPDQAKQ